VRGNQSNYLLLKSKNRLNKMEMIVSIFGFMFFFGVLLAAIIYCWHWV
jgi:hypothetical protein